MNCYICATKGKTTPAVAICIACGMAVCMDHLVREDLPVEDIINWGLAQEKHVYPKKLPRILCRLCYDALHQRSA